MEYKYSQYVHDLTTMAILNKRLKYEWWVDNFDHFTSFSNIVWLCGHTWFRVLRPIQDSYVSPWEHHGQLPGPWEYLFLSRRVQNSLMVTRTTNAYQISAWPIDFSNSERSFWHTVFFPKRSPSRACACIVKRRVVPLLDSVWRYVHAKHRNCTNLKGKSKWSWMLNLGISEASESNQETL